MRSSSCGILLLIVLHLGCAGNTIPADSPQATLVKAQAAWKEKDWPTYVDCLTPESQTAIVQSNVLAAVQFRLFLELAGTDGMAELQKLNDILVQYGVSAAKLDELAKLPGDAKAVGVRAAAEAVTDPRSLVADLLKHGQQQIQESKIVEVKIDGDRATAISTVTVAGRTSQQQAALIRTASGWKLDQTGDYTSVAP